MSEHVIQFFQKLRHLQNPNFQWLSGRKYGIVFCAEQLNLRLISDDVLKISDVVSGFDLLPFRSF